MSGSEKERLRARPDRVPRPARRRHRCTCGASAIRDRVLRIEWVGAYEYLALYYTIIVALVTLAMCAILYRWAQAAVARRRGAEGRDRARGRGRFRRAREIVGRGSMLEPIASAFNAMAERVQALLQSHRDLEQSVAHELRTPLAQLKFDLELARTSATPAEREGRFAGDGARRGRTSRSW